MNYKVKLGNVEWAVTEPTVTLSNTNGTHYDVQFSLDNEKLTTENLNILGYLTPDAYDELMNDLSEAVVDQLLYHSFRLGDAVVNV